MMIGGLPPWISNIIFIFKIEPLTYFDLTPTAFIISGLAFMWGILRYRLLDIVPIARDIVLQNMKDGVVVVDNRERLEASRRYWTLLEDAGFALRHQKR